MCVCVCERERERACVCVCDGWITMERERQRISQCSMAGSLKVREMESVCSCVGGERESERETER